MGACSGQTSSAILSSSGWASYTASMQETALLVRPFVAADQDAARRLILAGLGEHFDLIDETYNPDLDDILTHYIASDQTFLVAALNGALVGTGALIGEGMQTGRIVRMSVARNLRRKGIAQALMARLMDVARERGFVRLVLETNIGWDDAIGFYQRCGFQEYDRADGLIHLALNLKSTELHKKREQHFKYLQLKQEACGRTPPHFSIPL